MKLKKAIQYALNHQAVLFLGSGFSTGTRNQNGKQPSVGKALAQALTDACGFTGENIPLETIATEYARQNGEDKLISFLQKEYTLTGISPEHVRIMSVPYLRVYTTNYDLCAEMGYAQSHPDLPPMKSVTLCDRPSESITSPVCVHLNGSISRLTPETLNDEFRLTDHSYTASELNGKPWMRQFIQDIQSANAIIVVGYSMSFDLDIKRHFSSPEIRDKLVYICSPTESAFNVHLLEEYGECYKIGTSGLRDEIEAASEGFTLSSKPHYTSFKEHVTPYAVGHIGYNDITHMYYLGDVPDRLFEKLPTGESRYLVDRSKLEDVVDDVCSFDGKPVLVTGNLGSGKTIFIRQLIQRLHQKNVHIFTFEKYNSGTFSELASILQLPRTVLIIDNYSQCMDILDQLQFRVNRNFALVLTERSSIHRIKTNQFKKIFPVYKFCSLTELTSPEVEQLSYQIVSNQLDYDSSFRSQRQRCEMVERKIKDNCKSQFSAILLDMFGSSDIRQRLVQQFNASPKKKAQQLISFALFSTILNLRVTLTDMLELLDIDYVGLNLENDPTIQEFFNISDDHFQVRSSVIAKELLYQVQDVSVLIDALITVVDNIGDSYKDNFGHRELLKSLLSHSNFIPFLSSAGEANANEIYRFYDSVRNTPFCQQDPLFWEQFASACIDSNNFVDALSCLRTAFSRADAITGYVPYQIETVYARYLIESCLYDISIHPDFSAQSLMDCISKSYESLFKYYDYPDNQPPYTFATAKKYGTIWEKYSGQLSDSQRGLFQSYIQDILKKVKTFYENSPMDAAKDPCYLALIQCRT